MVDYFLNRLKERSTWLGLIAVATAFGLHLSPDQQLAIAQLGLALAGGTYAITKDE
jgi:hypothetical protein